MAEHRWSWKLDLAADTAEPPAPRVVYLPSERLVFQDFEGGYRMALSMVVYLAGPLDQPTADDLVQRAQGICPFQAAIKNNVTVNLKAVLDTPA